VRLAAAVFLIAATTASAQAPGPEPMHVSDPAKWGSVRRLVEPEFPRRALAEGRSGYVDVRGRVSATGTLEAVEYSPENPQAGVFIDPIRRVLRYWEFQPPIGRTCQPSEERVVNRVWFEAGNGKPHVSVTLIRPQLPGAPRAARPLASEQPRAREAARRAGDAVAIYSRVNVDAAGEVVSVEPRAYFRRRGTNTRELEHEVIRALTQWRFPAAAEDATPRVICHDAWFRPG
jgi:hypothetical protein